MQLTLSPKVLADRQVNPKQLFNAPVPIDLESILCKSFKNAVDGATTSFLHNIDVYLKHAHNSATVFMNYEHNVLMGLAETEKAKTLVNCIPPMYKAIMGVLDNYVCVGIDCGVKEGQEHPTYEANLYTRNIHILENLDAVGLLSNPDSIPKHRKELVGTKTVNGFKEETVHMIRLEVVDTSGKHPVFGAVAPRSRVKVGVGSDMVIIPVAFYYIISDMLQELTKDKAFQFVKQTEVGPRKHIATFSPDVVRKHYGKCESDLVETKLRKVKPGFNVAQMRVMAYDLESSINSLGVASFRPEMLDSISCVNLREVDKTMHNVDGELVLEVFTDKVAHFNVAQLKDISFFDVKSFVTPNDARVGLVEFGKQLQAKDLYILMKQNSYLFGDVDGLIKEKCDNQPKILKELDLLDMDYFKELFVEDQVTQLEDMLNAGVVKVTATTKDNRLYTKYLSNNPKVLEQFLGEDYVSKFESISYRLKAVKHLVESGQVQNKAELEHLVVKYDIMSSVNSHLLLDKAINKGNTSSAIQALDEALEEIKNSRKANLSKTSVRARNIKASEEVSFYTVVTVPNIISIEYASLRAGL
jgi:hypothetical protein